TCALPIYRFRCAARAVQVGGASRTRPWTTLDDLLAPRDGGRREALELGNVVLAIGILCHEVGEAIELHSPTAHRAVVGGEILSIASQQIPTLARLRSRDD